jgi:Na+-translocating ferredoxin:NAD+ oxidoreductase RnfC subunit
VWALRGICLPDGIVTQNYKSKNLKQHTGVPSEPVVKINEPVNEGDLIAEIPKEKLGARLHSSIKGRITYIDEERIIIKK